MRYPPQLEGRHLCGRWRSFFGMRQNVISV
jgi:hypothetical protein